MTAEISFMTLHIYANLCNQRDNDAADIFFFTEICVTDTLRKRETERRREDAKILKILVSQ